MPPNSFAENHDWDLTLRAAWVLATEGQVANSPPSPVSATEKRFSCFTGSMLLSFCAIESYSASVAFCMPRTERFKKFDYDNFRRTSRFWDKIDLLCGAIPHKVDRSRGLFQIIATMQQWRNLVTHASPYRIEQDVVPGEAEPKLYMPEKQFARRVTQEDAYRFYTAAYDYIDLISKLTGIGSVEETASSDSE